jgi:aryl-alcohol dehydrogenase-like predicted oxidoreductase
VQYRYFGRTGLKVSVACMGSMTFGREIGEKDSHEILDLFASAGGTFIDTADNIYSDGASEEIVGRWLKKQPSRDQWVIATKVGFPTGKAPTDVGLTRKHILQAIDASLARLQTDYVDLYQVHWWDNGTPIEETLSALDQLVRSGKVRYIGCSNFTAWQLVQSLAVSDAHGLTRFASLQPMYSLLVREPEMELLPACIAEGLAFIPYSPLARGAVTGKQKAEVKMLPAAPCGLGNLSAEDWEKLRQAYDAERVQRIVEGVRRVSEANHTTPARVALAWAASRKGIPSLILGARTVSQLEDNLGFVGLTLSDSDIQLLDDAGKSKLAYPHEYIDWANTEYKRG